MSEFDTLFEKEYKEVCKEHPEYSAKETCKEISKTMLAKMCLAIIHEAAKRSKQWVKN